jgi:hypothetical protein
MLEGYIDNSAKALFFGGSTLVLLLSNYEDLKRGAVIVGLSYILGAIAYYKPLYGISIGTFSVIYPFLRDNFSCGAAGVLAALIGVTTGSICELYRLRHIQNHLH